MATRTSLAWILLGALIFAGTQRGDAVAPRRVAVDQDGARSANPVVLRIDRRDKMTPAQLNQLRSGSATARELLVRVANLRDTILILRADPALVVRSGLYGRSRFWVHSGRLFGYIQYQAGPLNTLGTQCLIVHELAHAMEIACANWRAGTEAVRSFVLSRALGSDPSGADGWETEFPQQVALAVLGELQGATAHGRSLAEIAEAHHIALPPAISADGRLASGDRH
jgi:hypothetical protein